MKRLGRSGRALWLVLGAVSVSCGKERGTVGGSAGTSTSGSSAAVAPRARISPSSASVLPVRFASNGDLTQWVDRLEKNAISKGKWDRSCKPGCSKITVELSVVPGAHFIDYDALGSTRPAVAIIEPVPNQPANKTTNDPYTIETGNFTYVVYVEQDPASKGMVWHILKVPYTIVNNVRQYDLTGVETLGGHPFTACQPIHQSTDDDAAFRSCSDAHPAARTSLAAPAARKAPRADTLKLLAPGALARSVQDTSRTGDPLKPLWVSCLDGCCTAGAM